jgi:transcription termination factor Rho
MMPDGYGLRSSDYNYLASPDDIYLSTSQIRLPLKPEIQLRCGTSSQRRRKVFPLVKVLKINGHDPQVVRDRVSFEHLTPVFHQRNLIWRQDKVRFQLVLLICFLQKDNVV